MVVRVSLPDDYAVLKAKRIDSAPARRHLSRMGDRPRFQDIAETVVPDFSS